MAGHNKNKPSRRYTRVYCAWSLRPPTYMRCNSWAEPGSCFCPHHRKQPDVPRTPIWKDPWPTCQHPDSCNAYALPDDTLCRHHQKLKEGAPGMRRDGGARHEGTSRATSEPPSRDDPGRAAWALGERLRRDAGLSG